MQRVLVTFGAGLVGSHLCDRLLAEGLEVLAVDDLSRGSFANVAHLEDEPRFLLEQHDPAQPFDANVDAVVHLANEAQPLFAMVNAMSHALQVAAARGARVVVVTSWEAPREGCVLVEALADEAARAHGLDVRIVRLPVVYGPRMPPDTDHPVSARALETLLGEPPAPLPDGARYFAYVTDAVDVVARALLGAPAPSVAPFVEASAEDIAAAVAAAVGTSREETSADSPPALPGATPLPVGIRRTVSYFEERLRVGPRQRISGVFCRDDVAKEHAS